MGGNAGDIIVSEIQSLAGSAAVTENVADTARHRLTNLTNKNPPSSVTRKELRYMLDCICEAHENLMTKK